MNKLNTLLNQDNVKVLGFPAFAGLTPDVEENKATIFVSTLPAAQMLDKGIKQYYAPVIPRFSKFYTTKDVLDADLDLNTVDVQEVEEIQSDDPVVIVTQHQATIDVLQSIYTNVNAVITGNASVSDVKNKNVVGVLPPFLVSECARFKAYSIEDYNSATDNDLDSDQIAQRLITNKTIKVTINKTIKEKRI
ncbi:hypothetical protein GQR36_17455 [Enterococcus termitis]